MSEVTKSEYKKALSIVNEYKRQMREIEDEDLEKCLSEIQKLIGREDVDTQRRDTQERSYYLFLPVVEDYHAYETAIKYGDKVKEIGEKHNIDIRFPYYYYPK